MRNAPFRTTEDRLRANLLTLFDTFSESMGLAHTAIAEHLFSDRQLAMRLKRTGMGFRIRTYDMIVGRFSSLWPADVRWPAGIDRVEEPILPERFDPPVVAALPAVKPDADPAIVRRRDKLAAKFPDACPA